MGRVVALRQLRAQAQVHELLINPVIYAELSLAVNPRTRVVRDNRTSVDHRIDREPSPEVDTALARLKALRAADPMSTTGD
ncbi:MAG TPA: hypothetical protein VKV24_09635 [Casimicrobiaceae bacterium]|nr:hypothetical protein [Casimicrobiaceae bacterium]